MVGRCGGFWDILLKHRHSPTVPLLEVNSKNEDFEMNVGTLSDMKHQAALFVQNAGSLVFHLVFV